MRTQCNPENLNKAITDRYNFFFRIRDRIFLHGEQKRFKCSKTGLQKNRDTFIPSWRHATTVSVSLDTETNEWTREQYQCSWRIPNIFVRYIYKCPAVFAIILSSVKFPTFRVGICAEFISKRGISRDTTKFNNACRVDVQVKGYLINFEYKMFKICLPSQTTTKYARRRVDFIGYSHKFG